VFAPPTDLPKDRGEFGCGDAPLWAFQGAKIYRMNRINKESVARRFQSFDTELPDEVRVEFARSKRSRVVDRSQPIDRNTLWLAGAILSGAIILALGMGAGGRRETQQPAPTLEPNSAAKPRQIGVPTLAPTIDRKPASGSEVVATPYAPRATLVKWAPPRAILVRLPQWRIGEERPVMMPYGLQVAALLKGRLPSTEMLPTSGNALGDTWVIGDSAWVWIVAPGAGTANWIDP
jgi:hypothetical protein